MNQPNTARLPAARKLLSDFRTAGRVSQLAKRASISTAPAPDPQRSPAGWPIARAQLTRQLEDRLAGRSLPSQLSTNYCGVAAFLYCLLEDRPDLYVLYAISLWEGDHFTFHSARADLNVRATKVTISALSDVQQTQPRTAAVSDLDWMTMASLSSATHMWTWNANPKDLLAVPASITYPWMMRRWFASVGSVPSVDSVGIGLFGASISSLLNVLTLWSTHWLILEIDASLLIGGGSAPNNRHWVVVDPFQRPLVRSPGGQPKEPSALRDQLRRKPLGDGPPPASPVEYMMADQRQAAGFDATLTSLKLVSWGEEPYLIPNPTLGHVGAKFYGGFAFPHFR